MILGSLIRRIAPNCNGNFIPSHLEVTWHAKGHMVWHEWTEKDTDTFEVSVEIFKKSLAYWSRESGEVLLSITSSEQKWRRGATRRRGKYYAPNTGKKKTTLKQSHLIERRNLWESGDSSVTRSAVAAVEMNLPKFRTCTVTALLRMTWRKRRKRFICQFPWKWLADFCNLV